LAGKDFDFAQHTLPNDGHQLSSSSLYENQTRQVPQETALDHMGGLKDALPSSLVFPILYMCSEAHDGFLSTSTVIVGRKVAVLCPSSIR
jgi:hypothetical protein